MKGGRTRKDSNRVVVDGPWIAMPLDFLASRSFAQLSTMASKLLFALIGQLGRGGYGNGRLDAHPDRLKALGWTSTASAQAALHELVGAGLVVCTRQGAKGRIGLYGITLFPMHCKHADLDVGPGAWATATWRAEPDAAAPPTKLKPAVWCRPRRAEKRNRSTRSGNESGECAPAAGTHLPQTVPCIPVAGTHTGVSEKNAFPQRDSPSRTPSAVAAAATAVATAPAARRGPATGAVTAPPDAQAA